MAFIKPPEKYSLCIQAISCLLHAGHDSAQPSISVSKRSVLSFAAMNMDGFSPISLAISLNALVTLLGMRMLQLLSGCFILSAPAGVIFLTCTLHLLHPEGSRLRFSDFPQLSAPSHYVSLICMSLVFMTFGTPFWGWEKQVGKASASLC